MTSAATTEARTAALRDAREKDSREKRNRALAALGTLKAEGAPISFVAVAKAAGVSRSLVYAEGVRDHVEAARARRGEPARRPSLPAPPGCRPRRKACEPTSPSLARKCIVYRARRPPSKSVCACSSVRRSRGRTRRS